MKINMYERTCLTRFAVFSTEYEGVLAKQVPEEELIGEPAWYSSNDLIRLQLRKPQENYPEPFLYNPLSQTPNLYLEIAKIKNEKDLRKFVKIYGLPIGTTVKEGEGLADITILIKMEMIDFYEELDNFQNLLNLWYETLYSESISIYPSFFINGDFISNRNQESREIIAKVLNYKNTWTETIEYTGEVKACVRFRNLFEVAYYQLTNAILNKAKFRKCMECGAIFEVTHESQKFCPPKLGNKRSTCENTFKVRKRRQSQKNQR